jgi:hypothetical protein
MANLVFLALFATAVAVAVGMARRSGRPAGHRRPDDHGGPACGPRGDGGATAGADFHRNDDDYGGGGFGGDGGGGGGS